jgi:hypothetical protein
VEQGLALGDIMWHDQPTPDLRVELFKKIRQRYPNAYWTRNDWFPHIYDFKTLQLKAITDDLANLFWGYPNDNQYSTTRVIPETLKPLLLPLPSKLTCVSQLSINNPQIDLDTYAVMSISEGWKKVYGERFIDNKAIRLELPELQDYIKTNIRTKPREITVVEDTNNLPDGGETYLIAALKLGNPDKFESVATIHAYNSFTNPAKIPMPPRKGTLEQQLAFIAAASKVTPDLCETYVI